ncbi:WxL domain-containing protein [Salinicoccus sp. RF5]|uniref:WxL domain-containing protein n=1 Tax=Salinicoccus sp. RF5 TaxID=2748874 RepID=UPI001E549D01|nr:WxL domain-containing protein [Salinicoccus sp. RF5]MCC4722268.1 WxL domain-containing protein [Salinicoccus sp. RF5]
MNFKKWMAGVLGTGLVVSMGVNSATAYGSESNVAGSAPSEAKVEFTGGHLTLDNVTSISFGNTEVTSKANIYNSADDSFSLQVTDERGTGGGWHLTARALNFHNEAGQETLIGSKILLDRGSTVDTDASKNQEPGVTQEIKLYAGGDSTLIVNASSHENIQEAQGVGTWVAEWDNTSDSRVKLDVPARSASTGKHTADIEWTLYNGPATENQ